ncbi:MAG: NitT/TauT family transport system substrate-binding protein [Solirubrobacteraceae bacterium]|jgi:NitT/TauT family transport system substrate-binding protein|nr:NitT/TauT family transport system substrate-binding protein [Solirubrobacteraceae bacterium]
MRRLLTALAVVALLALGACGGDDDETASSGGSGSGEVTKVKVGVLPISNVAPLYVGMKQGFFEEEGLEVEPVPAQSGNEIVTAMVSGDLQFGFLGFVPMMAAVSKELPLKVVASSDTGAEKAEDEWTVIVVGKDSPIKDVADLAGKTIAVNALKGVGEVDVKAALDKRGVDPDSIKLLEVPFPEMPAALERKRVDAIWAPEPFLSSVLGDGGREIEAPLTTLGPNYPNGTYSTTEKQLAEDEDVVAAFTRAINKSMQYATENPDAARATIPEFSQIPKEVAEKIRLPLWPVPIDTAKVSELGDYAVKYKVIESNPPPEELIWEGAETN